ncbi:PTS transporter subunit EIIA [Wenzhouxiangella sp. XN79A]|uniref:PTS sugar transporter subunit IIA n=1 Tax=Wenzhouxiangella sp. XN79A TaxID=2724193 RepID=UPI00144AB919|nr:PTS sugar transporter subunit IIA [Wenzhouxiangella sp. XN79A]NKI35089.1 PTS transporter subunit EIIA [Wenzhouxiangella sp. XN79A]
MRLADLLTPDRIALDRTVSSKKSLLEAAAGLLGAAPDAAAGRDIFHGLCQRERLGSTGLGHGVAIPHCRIEQPGASGALIRLTRPIDFDSPDAEPVDLFFALVVPSTCSEGHLKLLAGIAQLFSDPDQRERLRGLDGADDVIRVLNDFEP